MVITDIERMEWAHHPVTLEFMERLENALQEAKDAWAGEAFIGSNAELTSIYNATAIGGVRVLKDNIEYITGLRAREEV